MTPVTESFQNHVALFPRSVRYVFLSCFEQEDLQELSFVPGGMKLFVQQYLAESAYTKMVIEITKDPDMSWKEIFKFNASHLGPDGAEFRRSIFSIFCHMELFGGIPAHLRTPCVPNTDSEKTLNNDSPQTEGIQ